MSARAGRWDLLEYNSDPVPGCPERVRAGAQRYVETAEEIRIFFRIDDGRHPARHIPNAVILAGKSLQTST